MRVLAIGDVAHTGFGRVTREIATGLIAKGHDLRVIGINHRGIAGEIEGLLRKGEGDLGPRIAEIAASMTADPLLEITVPANEGGDGMGHNLTKPAMDGRLWKGWKPEGAVLVADPKAMLLRLLNDGGSLGHAHRHGMPVLNYVPIEGTGLPPSYRVIWQFSRPVAMSAFGAAQLETLLGEPVPVALHGVSPDFRPVTASDPGRWQGHGVTSKDGAKAALGLAGKTIILRADRFIYRKNYAALFRVMRPVLAAHPDAVLVIHCALNDEYGDIRELVSREPGAVDMGNYNWAHPQIRLLGLHDTFTGLTDEGLRVLYNAADLYVSPTMAEGFGLCLAEALACEVPVVATDYSAIGEVVGPGGALIPPVHYVTNAYAHEWALVDEAAMSAAVERLVAKPSQRAALGKAGRRHVSRFTWSSAVDVFDDLLRTPAAVAA